MTRPLRIVLIKDGEPLPQLCAPWTLRTGNLARELASRGHDVTWLSSTFMHYEKKLFCEKDHVEEMPDGYQLRLLSAGQYRRNISVGRFLHHIRFSSRVLAALFSDPKPPDIIISCVPTLENAAVSLLYGRRFRIPVVLDIRDLWPEIFVTYAPPAAQPALRLILSPYFAFTSTLFSKATSLVSSTFGCLKWAQGLGRRQKQTMLQDRVFYHGAHEILGQVPPDPFVPTSGLRTLFAGSISRGYDLTPILNVARKLASQPNPPHFFFAGQGDRYDSLTRKYGELPNVTFTGWLKRAQIYALSQTCHVGWLPLADGTDDYLPNKVFEYASMGLATAVPSIGEAGRLVLENEMGFHYRDEESLQAMLLTLKPGDDALEQWKRQGLVYFQKHGNAKVCSSNFADHVEMLVSSGTSMLSTDR